ncbi:MAG TPA: hypothetical protein VF208_09105 [Candidatus Binatia bacterium]
MNRLPSPPIPRILATLIPSIGNIIFVAILLVLIFNIAEGLLGDGDTGYHIRTGEIILDTGQVPRTDIYSYIRPALKWIAHEWLAEVIMAILYRASGLTGVVLFFAMLLAATHWLLYAILRTESDDIILCTIVTLLATLTASSHWLARPHLFTIPLLLIWYHMLDQFQYHDKPTLKYLPFVMLLWVNLHGGFMLGIVLLAIYLVGNLIYSFTERPARALRHRIKAKALGFTALLAIAACIVNPVGIEIYWFPFRVASDRFIMDWVIEFMSPNFHQALPFKYMFIAVIGVLALAPKRLNLIESGLLTLVSYMALYSVRHVSVFAIVAAPILLRMSNGVVASLPKRISQFYQARRKLFADLDAQLAGKLWPAVAVSAVLGLGLVGALRVSFSEKIFPIAAVEFLKREELSGNMYNNDEFGDYLIFSAWPQYKVFADGRSDMYGERYGSPYLKVAGVQPGWKEILERYNISWIFFQTQTALSAALLEQADWHPIYSDKVATIFVRKIAEHQNLIAKYPSVPVQLSNDNK